MSNPLLRIPQDERVSLSVRNLTVSVRSSKSKKKDIEAGRHNILENVSFDLNSGEMLAIMGGSGSGKTTLLNSLSTRLDFKNKNLDFEGSIEYSTPANLPRIKNSYLLQTDIFLPGLSMYETLKFQADLRMPNWVTKSEKHELILQLLDTLELTHLIDEVVVSFTHVINLSGGEQRRLSLAIQLLSKPSLLFLDEPTTGLDASSSLKLVSVLKKLTGPEFGLTVILSIHQPRIEISNLFDNICLLTRGGRVVYYGTLVYSSSYFNSLGFLGDQFKNKKSSNFIDFIMDLSVKDTTSRAKEEESIQRIDRLVQNWSLVKQISSPFLAPAETKKGFKQLSVVLSRTKKDNISFLRELTILTKRTFILTYRDRLSMLALNGGSVFMACATGWLFYKPHPDLAGIRSTTSSLYSLMEIIGFAPMFIEIERLWSNDGLNFFREYKENYVSILGFVISRRLGKLLLEDFPVGALFAVITYFMWGLRGGVGHFFIFFAITVLTTFMGMAMAMVCFAWGTDMAISSLYLNIFYQLQNSACGFFVNSKTMPVYVRWTKYIAYFWYTFGALNSNQFSDWKGACPYNNTEQCAEYSGNYQLNLLGYPVHWTGAPIAYLCAWLSGFYVICYAGLYFKNYDLNMSKTKQNRIGDDEDEDDDDEDDYDLKDGDELDSTYEKSEYRKPLQAILNRVSSKKSQKSQKRQADEKKKLEEAEENVQHEDKVRDESEEPDESGENESTEKSQISESIVKSVGAEVPEEANESMKADDTVKSEVALETDLPEDAVETEEHEDSVIDKKSETPENDDYEKSNKSVASKSDNSQSDNLLQVPGDEVDRSNSTSSSVKRRSRAEYELTSVYELYHAEEMDGRGRENHKSIGSASNILSEAPFKKTHNTDSCETIFTGSPSTHVFPYIPNQETNSITKKDPRDPSESYELQNLVPESPETFVSPLERRTVSALKTNVPLEPLFEQDENLSVNIRNVNLSALIKKSFFRKHREEKVLLNDISADFAGNCVNAIMGPSGSGKTTLLNYISHRLPGGTKFKGHGETFLKGIHYVSNQEMSRISSYVSQHDSSLIPNLTVRETLFFQAKLRLSKEEQPRIALIVNTLIRKIGLMDCADTVIGSEFVKGVSGGEQRRVSIAVQLLSKPKILFLDEPTSGLDSSTALSILKLLRKLATNSQTTIVLTIHQPNEDMVRVFENILLLGKGGRVIYNGALRKIKNHFDSINYHIPDDVNVTNHILDLISIGVDSDKEATEERVNSLAHEWCIVKNKTPVPQFASPFENAHLDISKYRKMKSPFWITLTTIIKRQFLNTIRSFDILFAKMFQTILLAIVHTLFFARLKNSQQGISNRLGLVQEVLNLYFVGLINNVALYPIERDIFYQEYKDGIYGTVEFNLCYLINEIPVEIAPCLFFAAMVVFAVGLPATPPMFFSMFFSCFAAINCGESLGIIVNSIFDHLGLATNILSNITVLAIFMGGTMSLHMPKFFKAWNWVNPMKYAVGVCAKLGFKNQNFKCDGNVECTLTTGQKVLQQYGLDIDYDVYIGALVACVVIYRVIAFISVYLKLRYLNSNN